MKKNDAVKDVCLSKPPSLRIFIDEAFDNLRQTTEEGTPIGVEFVDGRLKLIRSE